MPLDPPIAHAALFSDLSGLNPADEITLGDQEAHHAVRVKRVRPGERIALLDGAGSIATGTIERIGGSRSHPDLSILITDRRFFDPIKPSVEIWSALPKGDRLDRMVDQLTQLGVSVFRPLVCSRSQRKPESIRAEKLARISDEALKQSRRPWRMEIADPIPLSEALEDPDAIVADGSGEHWEQQSSSADRIVVLIGPEGGWSEDERDCIARRGNLVYIFGRFVLRTETAACAAASVVLGQRSL